MKINTDPAMIDKVADLRAEIARLKGKHDERYCAWLQAQGEIERLKAALKEAARRLIANGDGFGANEAMNAASTLADEQEKMDER